jgi:type IV secretory pathway TrbD component
MISTGLLLAGVIAALCAPAARLYEIKAAFGVVIVCVAFATTIEVMMATTHPNREGL